MSRWLKALIGSAVSWLIGGVVGYFFAYTYEVIRSGRHEPDGEVASLRLTVWAVVWLVGSIAYLAWVFREPPSDI